MAGEWKLICNFDKLLQITLTVRHIIAHCTIDNAEISLNSTTSTSKKNLFLNISNIPLPKELGLKMVQDIHQFIGINNTSTKNGHTVKIRD